MKLVLLWTLPLSAFVWAAALRDFVQVQGKHGSGWIVSLPYRPWTEPQIVYRDKKGIFRSRDGFRWGNYVTILNLDHTLEMDAAREAFLDTLKARP